MSTIFAIFGISTPTLGSSATNGAWLRNLHAALPCTYMYTSSHTSRRRSTWYILPHLEFSIPMRGLRFRCVPDLARGSVGVAYIWWWKRSCVRVRLASVLVRFRVQCREWGHVAEPKLVRWTAIVERSSTMSRRPRHAPVYFPKRSSTQQQQQREQQRMIDSGNALHKASPTLARLVPDDKAQDALLGFFQPVFAAGMPLRDSAPQCSSVNNPRAGSSLHESSPRPGTFYDPQFHRSATAVQEQRTGPSVPTELAGRSDGQPHTPQPPRRERPSSAPVTPRHSPGTQRTPHTPATGAANTHRHAAPGNPWDT